MGNNNDSLKNNNTPKTVQNHPDQQTSDNTPSTSQNNPLQETFNNTPKTAQNQSPQKTCVTLLPATVPSVPHKLCPLCEQKIDAPNYRDHVSNCTGQKSFSSLIDSYSSNQNPNFDRNNDTRTTHRQLQTEIDSTNENADYLRSRASTSYLKKASFRYKPRVSRSRTIDEPNFEEHIQSSSADNNRIAYQSLRPMMSHSQSDLVYGLGSLFQKQTIRGNSNPSLNVYSGDLITQKVDVIVVCSTSEFLFKTICKAAGSAVQVQFDELSNKVPKASVIAIDASGQVAAKKIYFLEWKMNNDPVILRKSIEKFVSDAIDHAANEDYQTIAFPAIGCGKFGCSIAIIAQTMVGEAYRKLSSNRISVAFVIQPDRKDIHDEFQKHIDMLQQPQPPQIVKTMSTTVGNGVIEVVAGDITAQRVDVIVGSSSSANLIRAIIGAAGDEVQTAYNAERQNQTHSLLISTGPGRLPCKRIFFLEWKPDNDEARLRQSLIDLIWIVIQHIIPYNFTSIAFPAIGCGAHGCSVDLVVKTIVKEIKNQLVMRNLAFTVKFVIQPDQQNVYDEFCKQVLTTQNDTPNADAHQKPPTWVQSIENKTRFVISATSDEYKSIATNFQQAMKTGQLTHIIQIERIQNERWFSQYLAHNRDFQKRHNTDTEKSLYHGCPETAVNMIIEDCFNRSFAGKNGTAYGVGVYFSSNPAYSHSYASPNTKGERHMFVARVLVGKTTPGNGSMKTRPLGFDSTTGESHIFVTYHDAQAYAEYLITYK